MTVVKKIQLINAPKTHHRDRIYPNVAETFGPKALRSIYIRPLRNDCPFSGPHRMFNTLSFLKMVNPAFGGTDLIYSVLNSNFMQR